MRSTVTLCGDLVRATVFTSKGSSTQTFKTAAEARAFINAETAKAGEEAEPMDVRASRMQRAIMQLAEDNPLLAVLLEKETLLKLYDIIREA